MNRENMLTWIEALESEQYPQTQRTMYNGEGFCCLGVLCDINGVEWKQDSTGDFGYSDGEFHRGFPGQSVMDWLDVDLQKLRIPVTCLSPDQFDRLGSLGDHHPRISVASLNDYGFSFTEIAALLRKEFIK